jgi:glutathione S-transferase
MASNTVVIFDTPSRDDKTWSHHVLRILFSLHYKGISYSVESVEYPDIVSTFEPTTLKPKDDLVEPYEIPVIKLQTSAGIPQYHMLIPEIIQALENIKPEPSLLYNSPRSVEFRSRFGKALVPILQLAVGHVPNILSDRSTEFFRQKRKNRWGKSVDEWIVEHPIKEGLALAEPRLKELGDWIELTPGPFIDGEHPGYVDFTIASILGYVKAIGLTDAFDQLLGMSPSVNKLYNAVGLSQQGNIRSQSLFSTGE